MTTISQISKINVSSIGVNVIPQMPKNMLASDTTSFSGSRQPERKKSNTSAWLVAGMATVVAGLIIFRKPIAKSLEIGKYSVQKLSATEEKNINNLIAEGKLSNEYKNIFVKVRHLQGEDFAKRSYELIAEHLGYKGCSPQLRIYNSPTKLTNNFEDLACVVNLNKVRLDKESKPKIMASIRHELEHFIQASDIVRTEGQGIDALVNAKVSSLIKAVKTHKDICLDVLKKPIEAVSEKELIELEKSYRIKYKRGVNTTIYNNVIKNKGIIKAGTPEAKKVDEYVNSLANYSSLGNVVKNGKEINDYSAEELEILRAYMKNPNEIYAYDAGYRIGSEYYAFEQALNKK